MAPRNRWRDVADGPWSDRNHSGAHRVSLVRRPTRVPLIEIDVLIAKDDHQRVRKRGRCRHVDRIAVDLDQVRQRIDFSAHLRR